MNENIVTEIFTSKKPTGRATQKWVIKTYVEYVAEVEVPAYATREEVMDYWNPGIYYAKSDTIRTTARKAGTATR